MASYNDCIDKIIEIGKGALTKREAAELLRKFNKQTANLPATTRLESLGDMLTQMREQMIVRNELFDIHSKYIQLHEEVHRTNLISKIDNLMTKHGWTHRKAVDALMFGSPEYRQGLTQIFEGARLRFTVALYQPLEEAGLLPHWHDNDTLMNAIDLVWDPNAKAVSPEAAKIAKILGGVRDLSDRRLNSVGAYVLNTPRLLFNSKAADPKKIASMGKEAFVDLVSGLDLDAKFLQGMDDAEIKDYFGNVYERLKRGNQYVAVTGNFDGVGGLTKNKFANLAARSSVDYDIPFGSAQAYKTFMSHFADEPIVSILARRVDQIGRSVGLMEAFGPTPERTLTSIMEHYWEKMSPEDAAFLTGHGKEMEKPKGVAKAFARYATMPFKAIKSFYMDANPFHALKYMDGSTAAPVHETLARVESGARMLTTMATLPNGIFMQIPDLALKVSQIAKYGKNPFEGILSPITAIGNVLPSAEKQAFYSRLGASAYIMRATLAHQLGVEGYSPGMLSRMTDLYFKLNGMAPFDRINKQHTIDFMSSNLAWAIENPVMGKDILDLWKSYGFNEKDFETLRLSIRRVDDLEVVDPLHFAQDDLLVEKYIGAMNDFVNTATPTPGIREKAITLQGTRPGTVGGTAIRIGMMFKNYPIMLMTRVYPRIYFESGKAGMLSTMVSMMMLWYLGDSLKQLSQGKTPRDMSKFDNALYGLQRSGLGGLYSDFLMGEYHRNGMDFTTSFLGGPVAGKANDIASLGSALVHGDLTEKMAVSKGTRLLPNVHVLQTILDRAVTYGILESVDPGYAAKMDKQMKERTGQERLF